MRSNVKLGRVSGIEIGLHYSWLIITALIVFSLGQRFHQMNQSWSASEVWITAFLTAALFFVSLLLHELAHSLVVLQLAWSCSGTGLLCCRLSASNRLPRRAKSSQPRRTYAETSFRSFSRSPVVVVSPNRGKTLSTL